MYKFYLLKISLPVYIITFLSACSPIYSQTMQRENIKDAPVLQLTDEQKQTLKRTEELLNLPEDKVKDIIQKYNAVEAADTISQLVYVAREKNPDIVRLRFLIAHLEQMKATDVEQKRMNNLIIVFSVILTIFTLFLIYVLLDQRRIEKRITDIYNEKQSEHSSSQKKDIYRGTNS